MKLKFSKTWQILLIIFCLSMVLTLRYSTLTKEGFIRQYEFVHHPNQDNSQPTNKKKQIKQETLVAQNTNQPKSFYEQLAEKAELRTKETVTYNGSYFKISYPMGDVPSKFGVCTDVIIRTYRAMGIDLQEKVHNDMKNSFLSYPKTWRLLAPDTNIDHRRVPNLMTFFNRAGASLPITNNPADYAAGDIISWDLDHGLTHIGIVSNQKSSTTGKPLIVHNIGSGPKLEDMIFKFKIIGHYRYKE